MGTITDAFFTENDSIRIQGIGLKPNAEILDIELFHSVLGSDNPTMVIISETIICDLKTFLHTRNKGNIKIKMLGEDQEWTNQTLVRNTE